MWDLLTDVLFELPFGVEGPWRTWARLAGWLVGPLVLLAGLLLHLDAVSVVGGLLSALRLLWRLRTR
ncbi:MULTISPECIES: hypothetical protein [unclassified Deinococcus]|uniref:hypothetical protein n=1 Tax=unclassified Deinococcus TaxID=2623546 RepID=UPI001C8A0823|nr:MULTISPECIES: hypothetical protein [unclassified Deinococcus]MBX8466602.1 hypothetical protein [Deinococcus sp. RIT780]MCD0156210.1 hypothetical protein [Deinococcus sp. 6GRE01]MCD0160138.1 hypothetical protein [Deinococcus sp. 6YEL10]MCD0164198.1 hypothetical protein [Deinococcus sp. 12RED42]MCD0168351.1 hypothetical protein [Deinococcus sp. 23YEL01]